MSLMNAYTKDEILEMSMVEIAFEILKEEKQPIPFYEMLKRIAEMKEMSDEAVEARIAPFYTDMNIDGRFVCLGDNKWGLKAWYPVESSEEELSTTNKPKRKKVKDDDFDVYDEDFEDVDYDNLELDDELDHDEDETDDLDDDFDDLDEEDLDEEDLEDDDLEDDDLYDDEKEE